MREEDGWLISVIVGGHIEVQILIVTFAFVNGGWGLIGKMDNNDLERFGEFAFLFIQTFAAKLHLKLAKYRAAAEGFETVYSRMIRGPASQFAPNDASSFAAVVRVARRVATPEASIHRMDCRLDDSWGLYSSRRSH